MLGNWIKLATNNFSTVLTKNLRNPRDYAPLSMDEYVKISQWSVMKMQ